MLYSIDDTDKEILCMLQEDARNHTNCQIAEAVDIAPSTVTKRHQQLENSGVTKGYIPTIDYDVPDYPGDGSVEVRSHAE